MAPSDVTGNFDKRTIAVAKVASRGALPAMVGGDPAIAFPAVCGLSHFGTLNPVHFDARMDYHHDVQGGGFPHSREPDPAQ